MDGGDAVAGEIRCRGNDGAVGLDEGSGDWGRSLCEILMGCDVVMRVEESVRAYLKVS